MKEMVAAGNNRNIFKSIISSGIEYGGTYPDKRGVLLSNYISLILIFCLLVLFIIRRTVYQDIEGGLTLTYFTIGVMAFSLPILLNKFKFTFEGRLALSYLPVIFLWYIYLTIFSKQAQVATNQYDSFRMFLLVFSVIPYLVFDSKKWYLIALAALPYFISIGLFENIMHMAQVGYAQKGTPESGYELMQLRTLMAFLMLNTASFIFLKIINTNDVNNKRLVHELKEKSDEIETQNEELRAGQEQLFNINRRLEMEVEIRAKKILAKNNLLEAQNRQLSDFAHFNAHKLRSPVASILGLIGLLENYDLPQVDKDQVIVKIKGAATQLDAVVSEINVILDQKATD